MPIRLTCDCGRSLNIKDELAGKKIRCPVCNAVLIVPEPAPPEDAEEEVADILLADDPPEEKKPYSRSSFQAEPPPYDENPRKRSKLAPEKPKRRKPVLMPHEERRRGSRGGSDEGWFGNINGGVIGGMVMMLIAGVWFVGGLFIDRIFFYPPILFVVGFIAMIKGLSGGDS